MEILFYSLNSEVHELHIRCLSRFDKEHCCDYVVGKGDLILNVFTSFHSTK